MNYQDMTLNRIFLDVVNSIPTKIHEVLSTTWGKFIAALIFCGSFLGDRLPLLWYIAAAVFIDALWGISTAIKAKRFIFSKFITKSAIKIFAYVSIYGVVALVEKGYTDGDFMVTSSIIASILITSELWSILGHIGIAYPDFLVVKLLRRYLKGEMAKKLGIPEEELDDILDVKHGISKKNNADTHKQDHADE